MKTAILGASGYGGGELVRLVDGHPSFEVTYLGAHSQAGLSLGEVHPHLQQGDRRLGEMTADLPGIEVAFLALPHGESARLGSELADRGIRVVDLGSDFRLDTAERYEAAYGVAHPMPDQLEQWAYGLPELFRDEIVGAHKVASPGCYPTATLLALAPLVAGGCIDTRHVVVNALSGVSGAGRSLRSDLLFGSVDEGVRAYAVGTHRHRPEIEMAVARYGGVAVPVTFTPHLVPMQRGILATLTAPIADGVSQDTVRNALTEFAAANQFVEVIDHPPQTRWVVGSNRALIAGFVDQQTGSVVVMCAIDNLVKGAAGQAVQAANLMCGFDEGAGLTSVGWMP